MGRTAKVNTRTNAAKPEAKENSKSQRAATPMPKATPPEENKAVIIPVRRLPKPLSARPAKKIKILVMDSGRPAHIYVDTPDLDRREAERSRRHRRRARNLTISTLVLTLLMLSAGTYYTWYTDAKAINRRPAAILTQVAEEKPITPLTPASNDPESVAVVSFTTPLQRGSTASLYIQTLPTSECTINVVYGTTQDTQPALKPATADSLGTASWTWATPPAAPDGDWPIGITCARYGKTAVLKETLSIID